MKPVCYDLYCGLGGWAEGFLAEDFDVIGFDIERHDYGTGGYPGRLVLRNVLEICGQELKNASVIVASPPCTEYSYMMMPWQRARQIRCALLGQGEFPRGYHGSRTIEQLNALFDACFRIQREASAAAGRYIPLIVENVRGAQRWVGVARWHFGSYYLWGDVPALIPIPTAPQKFNPDGTAHPPGSWFAVADSKDRGAKSRGQNFSRFAKTGEVSPNWKMEAIKTSGHLNIRDGHGHTRHLTNPAEHDRGTKGFTLNRGPLEKNELARKYGSKSKNRKAASAMIAKISLPLAQHIARCFKST